MSSYTNSAVKKNLSLVRLVHFSLTLFDLLERLLIPLPDASFSNLVSPSANPSLKVLGGVSP